MVLKKVGFIIANKNFRDEELFYPMEILEDKDVKSTIISLEKIECIGKSGAKINPDMKLDEVKVEDFDAIIFVGGAGCKDFWHNKIAHKLCQDTKNLKKLLAAICSSVATLAYAGVLKGVLANSFEAEREILKDNGALLSDDDVVFDTKNNIITANGPKVAKEFGYKILEVLNIDKNLK